MARCLFVFCTHFFAWRYTFRVLTPLKMAMKRRTWLGNRRIWGHSCSSVGWLWDRKYWFHLNRIESKRKPNHDSVEENYILVRFQVGRLSHTTSGWFWLVLVDILPRRFHSQEPRSKGFIIQFLTFVG